MSHDLMRSSELKALVREAYARVDSDTSAVARKLYDDEQLASVPDSAVRGALGVGNHLPHAGIRPGDTVLDVGCGAGMDAILAARRAGPSGRVVALDFLREMLQRTGEAAVDAGVTNVELVEGEMEAIPLRSGSVDVLISNGVVNLSPRKMRVLFESARVLRPGGTFCVSDLTVDEKDLPPEILTHPAAWAG